MQWDGHLDNLSSELKEPRSEKKGCSIHSLRETVCLNGLTFGIIWLWIWIIIFHCTCKEGVGRLKGLDGRLCGVPFASSCAKALHAYWVLSCLSLGDNGGLSSLPTLASSSADLVLLSENEVQRAFKGDSSCSTGRDYSSSKEENLRPLIWPIQPILELRTLCPVCSLYIIYIYIYLNV